MRWLLRAWCSRSKAARKKHQAAVIVREWPSGSIENNIERFLDFARNDRQRILDTRTTIDESFRSSPQDELAVASFRKFSPVVFRPAVAGLLEFALPARRVRASSRRFWGRRPLIEKRCEDASPRPHRCAKLLRAGHSQLRKRSRGRTSRTQAGRQCKMPWTHSDLSISV